MKYVKGLLDFNSSRQRLLQENETFSRLIPSDAFVLDAGAGSAPYKSLFEHAHYESADFEQVDKPYAPSTYTCDLQQIPVQDSRFDFIVFNQVMEHLPEPACVLTELNRVLKPGGKMLYTGPLFYEEHEVPFDFFRYTQYGLRHLFETAGFVIERLDWLEGYFGTVGYQLNRMARYLPASPGRLGGGRLGFLLAPCIGLMKLGFACLSVLFHKLEMREKFTEKGYPKNYVVILSKPSAS